MSSELAQKAKEARLKVLELIYKAQTSHIGSNFSCIDILTVIFEKFDFEKDVFVLSKGWAAASLYYFLWRRGRITEEELNSYCQEGSKFIGLAEPIVPEIKIAGGSMGLGFPGAVGIALAKKLKKDNGKVYVLMSDGELNCGTTWESALIAAHHKLDNLVVIVDSNGFQAMGETSDILQIKGSPFYGWIQPHVDNDVDSRSGHDLQLITELLEKDHKGFPFALVLRTTKGKGVKEFEGDNKWHYWHIDDETYERSKAELNG